MNFKLSRFSFVLFCFLSRDNSLSLKLNFRSKAKLHAVIPRSATTWGNENTKECTGKGKKRAQKGVNSLTYLQALSLNSQKSWEVPGASYNLRTPVTLKKIGLNPKLVSALIFNSRSYMKMTTWVDKQGFKTKPGFINPTKVLPAGLRQIIEELWLRNVFTTGNL